MTEELFDDIQDDELGDDGGQLYEHFRLVVDKGYNRNA